MIPFLARTWRGTTRAADADAYLDYLKATGLGEYATTPGNLGVLALRRVVGSEAEWLLVTLWDSADAIRAFTGSAAGDGDALTRAVFYPEDDRFLTARDERATHYELVQLEIASALCAGSSRGPSEEDEIAGAES